MTFTAITFTSIYCALLIVQLARRKMKSAKCLAIAVVACFAHEFAVSLFTGVDEVYQRITLFMIASALAYALDMMKSKSCIYAYGLMLFTLFMAFDSYYNPTAETAAYLAYPFVIIVLNIAILSALMTEKEDGGTTAIFDVNSWFTRNIKGAGVNKK